MTDAERRALFEREFNALVAKTGYTLVSAKIVMEGGGEMLVKPVLAPVAGWVPPVEMAEDRFALDDPNTGIKVPGMEPKRPSVFEPQLGGGA